MLASSPTIAAKSAKKLRGELRRWRARGFIFGSYVAETPRCIYWSPRLSARPLSGAAPARVRRGGEASLFATCWVLRGALDRAAVRRGRLRRAVGVAGLDVALQVVMLDAVPHATL